MKKVLIVLGFLVVAVLTVLIIKKSRKVEDTLDKDCLGVGA